MMSSRQWGTSLSAMVMTDYTDLFCNECGARLSLTQWRASLSPTVMMSTVICLTCHTEWTQVSSLLQVNYAHY